MSRRDEIRAELNAKADRMKPYYDAQARYVEELERTGKIDEVIKEALVYTEKEREADRRMIERYDQGLNPGDMDLIIGTVDEYIDRLRKRVAEK